MMFNPDNPGTVIFARAFKLAAEELGIEPTIAQIHGLADIENAVAAAAAKPNGGVFVAGMSPSMPWPLKLSKRSRAIECRRFIGNVIL